jgi:hypothetical protein
MDCSEPDADRISLDDKMVAVRPLHEKCRPARSIFALGLVHQRLVALAARAIE